MAVEWSILDTTNNTGAAPYGVNIDQNGLVTTNGIGTWSNVNAQIVAELDAITASKNVVIRAAVPNESDLVLTPDGSTALTSNTDYVINAAFVEGTKSSAPLANATYMVGFPQGFPLTMSDDATPEHLMFTVGTLSEANYPSGTTVDITFGYRFGDTDILKTVTYTVPFENLNGPTSTNDGSTAQYTVS